MHPVFKVVRVEDLVVLPTEWQRAVAKEHQFAKSLEAALNQMAEEGWTFVSTYGGAGSAYLIFCQAQ
jgi:hypothetical protein